MSDHAIEESAVFRWPVGVSHRIAAPVGEVWTAISAPGNLEFGHPFCKANPVQKWPGPESRDEVHYLSGWVYVRRFTQWIDGVGYDLEIGAEGESTSRVTWRLAAVDDLRSTLAISVYPHVFQGLAVPLRSLPHFAYVRPMLHRYLESVVRGFEWYITRGEPVPRNQFGSHPWFSPR